MRITTTTKQIDVITYIATDGKEFTSKASCLRHEWELSATKVFIVNVRGGRAEAYSSSELALKAAENIPELIISEVHIDERLWNTND